MKCPHCGHRGRSKVRESVTAGEVLAAVTATPQSIQQIADKVGIAYETAAPLLARMDGLHRTRQLAKGRVRPCFHYAREKDTSA